MSTRINTAHYKAFDPLNIWSIFFLFMETDMGKKYPLILAISDEIKSIEISSISLGI